MKRILFLDDSRERHTQFKKDNSGDWDAGFVHVYTAHDAIQYLKTWPVFDVVCLDHDLEDADPAHTGYAVAEFIGLHMDRDKLPKHVIIHSWNPSGAARMAEALRQGGVSFERRPFHKGFKP